MKHLADEKEWPVTDHTKQISIAKEDIGMIKFMKMISSQDSLRDKNSQACEQVNTKLRTIATTCTFMNPDMFMRSISLYLSYQNTKNSE